MNNYYVFKRPCKDWQSFARARKITVRTGLTYSEAQAFCLRENENRTPAQVRAGTKYEFTTK